MTSRGEKKKKQSKKITTVVVQKTAPMKRKRRGGGGGGVGALTVGFSATGKRAAIAAINPFHPFAEGCADITEHIPRSMMRLPVPFGTKVTTDAAGRVSIVLLPSLYCSGLAVRGVFGKQTLFAFASEGTSAVQTAPGEYSGSAVVSAAVSCAGLQAAPALFASQAATYRVVRWGAIIKTLPNMSANQGRIRIAKISPYGTGPITITDLETYYNSSSSLNFEAVKTSTGVWATRVGAEGMQGKQRIPPFVNTVAQLLSDWGVPVTNPGSITAGAGTLASPYTYTSDPTWDYEDLARLPTNFSSTINGLQAQALLIRGKANGPNPLRGTRLSGRGAGSAVMTSSEVNYSGGTNFGDAELNILTGTTAVDTSCLDMDGHDGIVISIDSAAASTDILDIELVYHIESTYRGQATSMYMRSCSTPAAVSPADHGKLVALDQKAAHYVGVPHHFKESLRGMVEGLGRAGASRAVAGLTDTISGVLGRSMARLAIGATEGFV